MDSLKFRETNSIQPVILFNKEKEISCPEWADKNIFNSMFEGLTNSEINSNAGLRAHTLKVLNQNQKGKSLLYLGSGEDIMHPLFATGANKITFVDSCCSFDNIENNLMKLINQKKYILKKEISSSNEAHFSVVDKSTNKEMFNIDIYISDYDSFIQKVVEEKKDLFDIVMDKDSWLKEWHSDQREERFLKIGSVMKQEGMWIGGFNTQGEEEGFPNVKIAIHSLFDRVTNLFNKALQQNTIEWSGYENLEVRIRTQKDVLELRKELEAQTLGEKVQQLENLNDIRQLKDIIVNTMKNYKENFRQGLIDTLKDELANSLPYLAILDDENQSFEEKNKLIEDIASLVTNFIKIQWDSAEKKSINFDSESFKQYIKNTML